MALADGRRAGMAARGPFAYREVLTQRLAEAEAQPKTARTRLKLMAGVVAVLEVANCAARAGVSHGTFYNYWPDGSAAAQAVLSDFMATVTARRPGAPVGASAHQRILAANRYYVVVYRRNAQLMRCLMQLGNAEPDFARIGQAANLALARRVVRGWESAEPARGGAPGPRPGLHRHGGGRAARTLRQARAGAAGGNGRRGGGATAFGLLVPASVRA
jgi:hypothetical protein